MCKKPCVEVFAKTGIKSVILGYQSILYTILDKIDDKSGELRRSITNDFPNVIKPLLEKKFFALYEDNDINYISIFKSKADRDAAIETIEVSENGELKDPNTYRMSAINLEDVFKLASKSWKNPENYTVYNHGGEIDLSLYDDKNEIKEI